MTRDQELFDRAQRIIPGGVDSPVRAFGSVGGTPLFITRAEGPHVFDENGDRFVDLVCSWGPALLGHAHPEVVEAVREAATRGLSFGAPTLAEVELAEAISARVPAAEQVRFVSTGTEATMTAVRLARGATGRDKIVKFAGCYHGHSDGLLAAAGSGVATQGLPGSAGVTAAAAGDTIVVDYNDVAALEAVFAEQGDQIAAIITEAAPCNMGVVPPAPGFSQALRDITKRHGALLIVDEVLTGFRVHPGGWLGLEANVSTGSTRFDRLNDPSGSLSLSKGPELVEGTNPDLVTFGKVVGGGMPLAALAGRADLMQLLAPVGPVYQAGTLSGNPLATAAGLATLRLADQGVYDHVDKRSAQLQAAVDEALTQAGVPHVVQHGGNLFSVFFRDQPVVNYDDAKAQDQDAFARFFHSMLSQGVALPPSAFEAWFLSAAHDDAAMEQIIGALPGAARAAARS